MKAGRKKPRKTELILTPLIDCVLFLMSFLLLVTEFSRQNEFGDIKLPDIRQASIVENPDPQRLVIMIKQSGDYYISGEQKPDSEVKRALELEARLTRRARDDAQQPSRPRWCRHPHALGVRLEDHHVVLGPRHPHLAARVRHPAGPPGEPPTKQ